MTDELSDVERVVKLTPEMQQAWVEWEPDYEPEPPLTPKQFALVRIAFFDGWLASLQPNTESAPSDVQPHRD